LFQKEDRPRTGPIERWVRLRGELASLNAPAVGWGLDQEDPGLGARYHGASGRLRITATNAFAARWLVPRLPQWRQAHPRLRLDIIGTDTELDLKAGEADVAIRYAVKPPAGGIATELLRDKFYVVASPRLVGPGRRMLSPAELARLPLIEAEWPPTDPNAPNWQRWQRAARARHKIVPELSSLASLSFREELHAIEAAVGGQGIAICSDVLIASELAGGALVPVSRITLPGYGFYVVYRKGHPKLAAIKAFITWIGSATAVPQRAVPTT
jgi:LysR family transcriptional regulator, glycine cleavage system transcriptional activator